ncbi:MAG: phosphatidylglycerol lysyltransferase domain-containing protein, partial [Christensenellaceae bacterium]|nr:phosphatidylglycerol lysyltransferase domain-containing protein [Christensenellaceae bacterium]
GEDENVEAERAALALAAGHYAAMGLEGLFIRAEGRVLAFAIGCLGAGDCFDVVFEKAYGEVQGAFAIINREFARLIRQRHPEVVFVNREDDMGLEGLRKAKESYHPTLEEKYCATLSLR